MKPRTVADQVREAVVVRDAVLAELRTRVEALEGLAVTHNGVPERVIWLRRDDVLAAINHGWPTP